MDSSLVDPFQPYSLQCRHLQCQCLLNLVKESVCSGGKFYINVYALDKIASNLNISTSTAYVLIDI